MRDIVERLELQAFVADKIQSGMKPLIMDCLEEITHLRCQYEALHKQGEMNARLLTENAELRAENEKLREALIGLYKPVFENPVEVGSALDLALCAAAAAIRDTDAH